MSQPIVPSITDEQLDYVSKVLSDGDGFPISDSLVRAMLSRLRAAEKDAARYRFIRENCDRRWDIMYEDVEIVVPADNFDDCDDLDRLVDIAIEQNQ